MFYKPRRILPLKVLKQVYFAFVHSHRTLKNSVLEHYTPTRTLGSSDTNLLCVPRVRTCFGSRGFSVAAPTIWNSLPLDIRNSCSIFPSLTQNFPFFNLWPSLVPRLTPAPQIRRVSRRQYCALYKFTYLLTYLLIFCML